MIPAYSGWLFSITSTYLYGIYVSKLKTLKFKIIFTKSTFFKGRWYKSTIIESDCQPYIYFFQNNIIYFTEY